MAYTEHSLGVSMNFQRGIALSCLDLVMLALAQLLEKDDPRED